LLLSAQNYEPFLFGKTYKYLNHNDSTLISQKIDRADVSLGGDSVFYSFREIYHLPDSINNKFIYSNNYTKTDKGYYFSCNDYSGNIFLKYNLNVNSIVSYKNQYLKYKGKENYTFLNISDSVKVFYLLDDSTSQVNLDTIYLSKNYGFVNGFNNYSLYSISELNIGNNHKVSYRPNIGDTLVWKELIFNTCSTSTGKSYSLKIFTQMNVDEMNYIFDIKLDVLQSYEYIKNGVYYFHYSPSVLGGSFYYTFRENVGLIYYKAVTCDGFPKDDSVVYFKGKAGEFGDRTRLDNIMSVEDIKIDTLVKIYPNPSEGKLTIDFANQESKEISVIDNLGKLIQQINTSNKQLDLMLDNGIYVIKVMTKNQVKVDKVLVE
jgi:hypothetical protein